MSSWIQSYWCNRGEVVCQITAAHNTDRDIPVCLCASINSSGKRRHPLRDDQLDTRMDGRLAATARRRLDGLFPGAVAAAAGRCGRVVAGQRRGGEESLSQSHFGTAPFFSASDTFRDRLIVLLLRSEQKATIHSSCSTVWVVTDAFKGSPHPLRLPPHSLFSAA